MFPQNHGAISFLSVFDMEMKEHLLLGITQSVIEAIAFNPTVTALSCYSTFGIAYFVSLFFFFLCVSLQEC